MCMNFGVDGWQEPTLGENLARAGVRRRDFLAYCGGLAAIFATSTLGLAGGAPEASAEDTTAAGIADKLGGVTKPNVVWLQLQECTGCMESTIRSGTDTIEELVLQLLSVDYNELLMAPSGQAADKALADANAQPHILVVNGSIPKGENGAFCTIGGKSAEQVLRESAERATAVLAVGACAVWGSVQAARPNPTGAVGVDSIITDKKVINVAGCPPIGEVITATVAYLLTHDGALPKTDGEGRPLFAYGQRIHDKCQRRSHFDAGQFVRTFDDEGAREGWCLYETGCKGPSTYSPCPTIQWNLHTSWPVEAGHPCLGCTEKDFFDRYTPFYQALPRIGADGVELSPQQVGWGLLGVATAGVLGHAGLTAAKSAFTHRGDRASAPIQAFGDAERVWQPTGERTGGQTGPASDVKDDQGSNPVDGPAGASDSRHDEASDEGSEK